MGKVNRKFYGLSQYKGPFCYELAGKQFRLVMDNGTVFALRFLDAESLEWSVNGETPRKDGYQCLKGDDTTYLVNLRLPEDNGRISYNWILDTEQRLVTMDVMERRYDKDLERLVRNTPSFGAMEMPGLPLPKTRHHFSTRMVGSHIFWHYNPGHVLQHIYHSPKAIRASTGDGLTPVETQRNRMKYLLESPNPEDRAEAERSIEAFRQREAGLLSFDEKVTIRREDKMPSCGALTYMRDGLTVTLGDLVTLMIILSDNTAANLLIRRLGIESVNATAAALGCGEGTMLRRPLFRPDLSALGIRNTVSARDMGLFLGRLLEGTNVSAEASEEMLGISPEPTAMVTAAPTAPTFWG